MNRRIAAIDLLRGAAIIGMVLAGQMLWNAELPAAMFHAQLPPPTFAFNPEVAGITWVDLVFPFFLFSMGAALPFSLRRKEQQGARFGKIALDAIHRWVWLAFFAIVLGNTRMGLPEEIPAWGAALATLGVWVLFFMLFGRLPQLTPRANRMMNLAGMGLLVIYTALYKPLFGVEVSPLRSDIIIMILANMALWGSLLWWLTRDNISIRICLAGVFALMKMTADTEGTWCHELWATTTYGLPFQFDFLKYLCIILPGSIAGDMIHRHLQQRDDSPTNSREQTPKGALTGLVLVMTTNFGVLLWGLFVRRVELTILLSALLSVLGYGLAGCIRGEGHRLFKELYTASLLLLALGLCAEPLEGGIKKDPATLGYFFTTSAMAVEVLLAALIMELRFHRHIGWLEHCGANPMLAYTGAGYLILPLITLAGLAPALQHLAESGPWMGVVRGGILVVAVIVLTGLFTRKRIFWKS